MVHQNSNETLLFKGELADDIDVVLLAHSREAACVIKVYVEVAGWFPWFDGKFSLD